MNASRHEAADDPDGEAAGRRSASFEAETLRHEADRAREAASQVTGRLGSYARAQLLHIAARQKAGVASAIADVGGHIRSLSRDLSDHPNLSAIADQAAESVEDAADAIERKPLTELYDDTEEICRRHPIAVAAGAAMLGALVSRWIMSSGWRSA